MFKNERCGVRKVFVVACHIKSEQAVDWRDEREIAFLLDDGFVEGFTLFGGVVFERVPVDKLKGVMSVASLEEDDGVKVAGHLFHQIYPQDHGYSRQEPVS